MTQNNPPGYPLPDGELGDDDLVCQLVYLPNRPEYWQALLAAIHYFSTWTAWERDDDKRGKDAAANWRDAFELTIGCWRMTCLEELTQTVTDILELLQNKKDCCDDNVTYLPVEEIETDIVPFEGDPPEVYGETEIEDWDEWAEHVCYNAHLYVDYLAHAGDTIWVAAKMGAIVIGLIAGVLTLVATMGIGAPVAYTLAAGIVSGIFLGGTVGTFAGSHGSIEAARDDIVCSIINGTGVAAAVEEALESGLDWDLFYKLIPYNSAMAIVYEGGHDSEFLSAETRSDCECDPVRRDYSPLFVFQSALEEAWTSGEAYWDSMGQPGGSMIFNPNVDKHMTVESLRSHVGLSTEPGDTIEVTQVEMTWRPGVNGCRVSLNVNGDTQSQTFTPPGEDIGWYHDVSPEWTDPPVIITHPTSDAIVASRICGSGACWMDNVTIHFTAE
jgi:hypothetical protein